MANSSDTSRNKWGMGMKGGGGVSGNGVGAVYGLGFIGAVIYYIQHATTFWAGVVGILKAVVWPAFLVYHLLQFLRM